jgi:DNA methylase/Phage terminase large subunit (GpA)
MCMSSSELHTLQKAFVAAGGHWSTFIIWAKDRFTLGRSDYQRQFEPILYGWPEGATYHWCGARDQGDVWLFRPSRNDLHPTMKPVGLVERAIRNSCPRGGLVLDPFGGSGTTLIAAERLGRVARMTAEQLVTVKTRRGFSKLEWQKLRERNEALDARVYARAAAWFAGVDRWPEAQWQELERQPAVPACAAASDRPQMPARAARPALQRRTVRSSYMG